MTTEEMDDGKSCRIEARLDEMTTFLRGISVQLTIIFDKISAIEDEMEVLRKGMAALEKTALGRRQ